MNLRLTRLILRLLTIACTIAVAGGDRRRVRPSAYDGGGSGPIDGASARRADDEPRRRTVAGRLRQRARPPLAAILGDAPTGTTAATSPTPALPAAALPQRLTLVGTVGESVALIRGPDGTVALVEVGDDVEGADVVAIREQQVDLRQGGRVVRLQKAPPPADAALVR